MRDKPLVTVVMPTYNSEQFVEEAIESVQNQSYKNWELCITDDCSEDSTVEILQRISNTDPRIKCYSLDQNSGAACARNNSLAHAQGRFVAYLDSDDLWYPEKLEKQLCFMLENGSGFSCASYEVVSEDGLPLNKSIYMMEKVDYKGFLTNNLLQTVGIMVDLSIVPKSLLVMPNYRRRQDAATWLQILKAGYPCYGIQDVLCQYRRVTGSLSSNKIKAAKGVWFIYRDVEGLSLPFSVYCFSRYALLAVWKRIYFLKVGKR